MAERTSRRELVKRVAEAYAQDMLGASLGALNGTDRGFALRRGADWLDAILKAGLTVTVRAKPKRRGAAR